MKRQTTFKYLARALTVALIIFTFNSCKDSSTNITAPPPAEPQAEIVGTWLQMPLWGEESMERKLTFTDGYASLIYPDRDGVCEGKPEILMQFSWEEVVEASNILQLNVFRHEECGVSLETPYEEMAYYSTYYGKLYFMSHTWLNEPNEGKEVDAK